MKNLVIYIIISIFVVVLAIWLIFFKEKKVEVEEPIKNKFATEYTLVDEDNLFVYKNVDEIINILEKGTGVVFLGFPECPWCQAYTPILNEAAKENGIKEIFYFNVYEDRKNNTEEYSKLIDILKTYLANDNEGKHRIFVPDVTIVKEGKIIGHDKETSVVTEKDGTPDEYWTKEKKDALKLKLKTYMESIKDTSCGTDCNS